LAGQTLTVPGSTVKLRMTSDNGVIGYGFKVIQVCVAGAGAPAPAGAGVYDDSDSRVVKNGGWTSNSNSLAYNGTYSTSNVTGASASFTFTGSSVTWYATKAYNRGFANVYIDGVYRGAYDLYSYTTQWQQGTTFSGLTAGVSHTIQIVVVGNRNASSTDNTVDVDAFQVM